MKKILSLVVIAVMALSLTAYAGTLSYSGGQIRVGVEYTGGVGWTAGPEFTKIEINQISFTEGTLNFWVNNINLLPLTTGGAIGFGNWKATFGEAPSWTGSLSNIAGDYAAPAGWWNAGYELLGAATFVGTLRGPVLGSDAVFMLYDAGLAAEHVLQVSTTMDIAGTNATVYGGTVSGVAPFATFMGINAAVDGPLGSTIMASLLAEGNTFGYGVDMSGASFNAGANVTLGATYYNTLGIVKLPSMNKFDVPIGHMIKGTASTSFDLMALPVALTFNASSNIAAAGALAWDVTATSSYGSMVPRIKLFANSGGEFTAECDIVPLSGLTVTPKYVKSTATFSVDAVYNFSMSGINGWAKGRIAKVGAAPLAVDFYEVFGQYATDAGGLALKAAGLYRDDMPGTRVRAYGELNGPIAGLGTATVKVLVRNSDAWGVAPAANVAMAELAMVLDDTTTLVGGVGYCAGISPYVQWKKQVSASSTLTISYGAAGIAAAPAGSLGENTPWASIAGTVGPLAPNQVFKANFCMNFN